MRTLGGILLILLVFVALQRLFGGIARKRRQGLTDAAAQLGLRVQEYDGVGVAVPPPGTARPQDGANRALASALGKIGAAYDLVGEWNGRDVVVTRVPGREFARQVCARFRAPLGLGLWIRATGSNAPASVSWHTASVASGDDAFDTAVAAAAAPASTGAVAALLQQPAVRAAILDALKMDDSAAIDDQGVAVVREVDTLTDAAALRQALDAATGLADAAERALRR